MRTMMAEETEKTKVVKLKIKRAPPQALPRVGIVTIDDLFKPRGRKYVTAMKQKAKQTPRGTTRGTGPLFKK
jgi:hypothetical protein